MTLTKPKQQSSSATDAVEFEITRFEDNPYPLYGTINCEMNGRLHE